MIYKSCDNLLIEGTDLRCKLPLGHEGDHRYEDANVEARRKTRGELEAEREGEWQERVAGPALGMGEDEDAE